jgi:hypothetical protein
MLLNYRSQYLLFLSSLLLIFLCEYGTSSGGVSGFQLCASSLPQKAAIKRTMVLQKTPSFEVTSKSEGNIQNSNFVVSRNVALRTVTASVLSFAGTKWISSGNGLFTFGFILSSLLMHKEYSKILRALGVNSPACIGYVNIGFCFLSALLYPTVHEFILPLATSLLTLHYFVFSLQPLSSRDISSSLLGLFMFGYLPSFWIRLRAIDSPQLLFSLFNNNSQLPYRKLSGDGWTVGALLIWWTWSAIATAGKYPIFFFNAQQYH